MTDERSELINPSLRVYKMAKMSLSLITNVKTAAGGQEADLCWRNTA